jgi:hypothetical protein
MFCVVSHQMCDSRSYINKFQYSLGEGRLGGSKSDGKAFEDYFVLGRRPKLFCHRDIIWERNFANRYYRYAFVRSLGHSVPYHANIASKKEPSEFFAFSGIAYFIVYEKQELNSSETS